jgi:hypothetical protein
LAFNGINLMQDLAENVSGPLADTAEHLTTDFVAPDGYFIDINSIFKRWGELTGQDQSWCLFGPNVGDDSTFLDIELRWDDPEGRDSEPPTHKPERLVDENMPADVERYVHWGYFRLRKYASHFDIVLRPWSGESEARMRARWRATIESKISRKWDDFLAYLNWRWLRFKKDHPGRRPPRQVILYVRRYTAPPPLETGKAWRWDGPHIEAIARWRPEAHKENDDCPLEIYDPVTREFKRVRRGS